jgi:hypothetical protein
MLLFAHFNVFAMQSHSWKTELSVIPVVASLFGISVAWLEWRREERRFEETINVSGTPAI